MPSNLYANRKREETPVARQQFLVVGLGRFGASVARTLTALGQEVLGIERDDVLVDDLKGEITHAAQGDATDEQVLQAIDAAQFDVAVVAIGDDFEANVLATHALKQAGVGYVMSRAGSPEQVRILRLVGADTVVYPEEDAGDEAAYHLVNRHVQDFMRLDERSSVAAVRVGDWSYESVRDLERQCGLQALGVYRDGRVWPVDPQERLHRDDTLLLAGGLEGLQVLARLQ